MSDPTDNGIDFYGDVDKELNHNDINDIDSRDLYDEVLSSRVDESHEREKNGGTQHHGMHAIPSMVNSTPMRQYQLYIGNLTWWTTDADITDSIENMGVSDFIEVKFYENVANGQSKGFCKISVASEASMKTIMDKMPKKDLHGRVPVVTYATKNALYQFESQFKCRPIPAPPPGSSNGHRHPRIPSNSGSVSSHHGMYSHAPTGVPPMHGPPPIHRPGQPIHGTHHSTQIPPPPIPQTMHPGASHAFVNGHPPNTSIPPPPLQLPTQHSIPPGSAHGPIPHVNPAIFPPGHPRSVPSHYATSVPPLGGGTHGLSNAEFEAVMSRNRTVSSSAIARAVQDASCNEYGSAIETLVTAISLIKQSKVANDDRCKILISSLQDTLHGIENKSYGARRKRSRSREREYRQEAPINAHPRIYEREREYRDARVERDRDGYRERSRSRDREFRVKEEKYYDDRERFKREDRERPRDYETPRMERDREIIDSGIGRGRDIEIKRERVDYRDDIPSRDILRERERERERERDRDRIRH